jgi:hypothetical protein
LAASDNSAWYHILHSVDYGQTFEEKYSFLFDLWYTYSFVAGRLPGTFYIFEEGICSTVPLHNCITIYFSRDYGATYTAYYHELDSTFTGISVNPEQPAGFRVFPNPAADELNVEFRTNPKEATLDLFDLYGRLQVTATIGQNSDNASIDVSGLTPGIYILKVREGEKVTGVEKVVVE